MLRMIFTSSFIMLHVAAAQAVVLVTPQEAALPDGPVLVGRLGVTRPPEIVVVFPAPSAGSVTSPFHLKVVIKAFGGATVDRDTIAISYVKIPSINVTDRLTPFMTANEIDIPNAEVPPGTHRFRITVSDNDGRSTFADFSISVR